MLGRIVPRQKGPNESTSNFVLRSFCVADRAIWSNPNAADKVFGEAHQFFSSAGDGACVARRLVFAIFGQGGQEIGRASCREREEVGGDAASVMKVMTA